MTQQILEIQNKENNKKKKNLLDLYLICRNFMVEMWTFFMIELKHQASLALVTALFSMVIPLGILLMISMMPIMITKNIAIMYISGNFITTISNLCISTLAQILIGIRMRNGFEHLATMPIYRGAPLLGTLFSSAISTVPALIIMPVIGMLLFGTTFYISVWLILVILLSIIIMTGIGAVIGTCSENYNKSNTISMIMMFFVMFGTPVYYAMDSLPGVVRIFQRMLPFCYSLEAMRSLMVNPVLTSVVIRDIIILIGFMLLSMGLTLKFFTWKQRS